MSWQCGQGPEDSSFVARETHGTVPQYFDVAVRLAGLTITGAESTTVGDAGGIFNAEALTVDGCVITTNQGDGGGGIAQASGTLIVRDSTISQNGTGNAGGAIFSTSNRAAAGWLNYLQLGVSEATDVSGFLLSIEFTGQNDNEAFVNLMYHAVLGRQAHAAGFDGWNELLHKHSRGGHFRKFLATS